MQFYEIGYSSWEECPIDVLCHLKKFTQDEFDNLLLDCYVIVSKKHEERHNEWISDNKFKEEDLKIHAYTPHISSMYTDICKMLEDEHGFFRPKITASFVASDTESIIPDDNRGGLRETYCDKLKLIRERFNIIEPRDNKINKLL
jgi:hypothetical protein